jgi:hypothetical protein
MEDNYTRWARHDDEQAREEARWRASLPRCGYCKQIIDDDWCFELDDECYCEECFTDRHRKWLV